MNEVIMMPLEKIERNAGTQMRVELREDKIAEYGEIIDRLFPSSVVSDGVTHWLVDGFHRWEVYARAGRTEMPVVVTQGTLRDAIRAAARANATHGLQRTAADKRRAVAAILADAEWAGHSDRTIAEMCQVSHHLVSKVRLTGSAPSDEMVAPTRTYTTKHGTVATMDVTNIGKSEHAPPPWALFEAKVRSAIAGLQVVKLMLIEAIDYDHATKTIRCPWAKYFNVGLIATIDRICRELEDGLPVELTSLNSHGYFNKKQRDIHYAVKAKEGKAA